MIVLEKLGTEDVDLPKIADLIVRKATENETSVSRLVIICRDMITAKPAFRQHLLATLQKNHKERLKIKVKHDKITDKNEFSERLQIKISFADKIFDWNLYNLKDKWRLVIYYPDKADQNKSHRSNWRWRIWSWWRSVYCRKLVEYHFREPACLCFANTWSSSCYWWLRCAWTTHGFYQNSCRHWRRIIWYG